ncbi:MAG: hypothetical protein ACXVQV_11530 [Actinomycetota bacterium]
MVISRVPAGATAEAVIGTEMLVAEFHTVDPALTPRPDIATVAPFKKPVPVSDTT